jgi:hypothetical protein
MEVLMTETDWREADTARAREIWAEYQKTHDVSNRKGQVAGVDPRSGRVWFGESLSDIDEQQQAAGDEALLWAVRVGFDYFARKGGHR